MPYVCEKIKIVNTKYDKRKKLSDEDIVRIHELHSSGMAIRAITRLMPVTRRRIQQIIFPDRYELTKKLRQEKGQKYYNKEKHTKAIREHRRYKQKLYLDGKIKRNEIQSNN